MDENTEELRQMLIDLGQFLDLPLTGENMMSAEIVLMAVGLSACFGLITKSHPPLVSFLINLGRFFYKKLNRDGRSERSKQVRGLITFNLFTAASFFITANIHALIPDTQPYYESWFNALILGLCISTSHSWFLGRKAVLDLDDEGLRKSEAPFYKKITKDLVDNKDPFQMGRLVVQFQTISLYKYLISPLIIYSLLNIEAVVVYSAITALDFSSSFKDKGSRNFGLIPSFFDWLINFIPSRIVLFITYLISLIIPFASEAGIREAIRRRRNAWDNSSLAFTGIAGALNISLSGPAIQNETSTDKAWVGPQNAPARVSLKNIAQSSAITLYATIMILLLWYGYNFSGI